MESYYRPTSTGVSDLQPVAKAAELATSGSHLVGRLSAPHPLTQSSVSLLAEDDMRTDEQQMQQSSLGEVPRQHEPQYQQLQESTNSVILAPTPQPSSSSAHLDLAGTLQQAVLQQEQQTGLQFLQQPPPLDPQAYAQQVLRNQDLLLAQAGSLLEPAFEPSHDNIPMSQSSTPTPYQPYITPPMSSFAQFQQGHAAAGMQYDMQTSGDLDMPEARPADGQPQQLQQHGSGSALNGNAYLQGGLADNRPSHPGSLDFTTLRGPGSSAHALATGAIKEEQFDGLLTSPYASSSFSTMSSFPFSSTIGTNTGTSVTSGSRSRATSLSKSTSAARSRAPSYSSVGNPYSSAAPDAQELEHILGGLTTLPSPINEDDDDYFDSFYENQSTTAMFGDACYPSVKGNSPHDANPTPAKEKDKDALEPELADRFQQVFENWLPIVCSDVEATDKRGEKIHQPLMAKRMAKLDEEHAFRPFKFRIQPFTIAFQDACKEAGMSEADSVIKHVSILDSSHSLRS